MRLFATAMTGLLLFGSAALADPPKSEPKPPAQQSDSQPHPQIILASAEPVRSVPEAAPVKRRVAPRATTCRCGDQPATPQPDEQ